MKLLLTADDRIGVERDGGLIDVSAAFTDIPFRTAADRMPRLLAALPDRHSRVEALAAAGQPEPMPALQAPVPRPPKLIAALGNDRDGANAEHPVHDLFLQSPDSVIGPGGTVILPNHPASAFTAAASLALVIGLQAKDLPADDRALAALAGYTCAIDVAAAGLGRIGPSRIGASFDTFTPLGPALVTADEVPDPGTLRVTLSVNGEPRQDDAIRDLNFGVPEVLAFVTSVMTLIPGDIVLLGSPHRNPGTLHDGDRLEATIAGIGTLAVSVRDPHHRT